MYDKFLVYKVETLLPTFYSLPPKKSKIASQHWKIFRPPLQKGGDTEKFCRLHPITSLLDGLQALQLFFVFTSRTNY